MPAWEQLNLYQRFVDQRQKDMAEDKDRYKEVQQDIVEYLRPDITKDTDASVGKQTGTNIVEGTGHFDAAIMAKWFTGNLVGPALPWQRYRMAESRLDGDDTFGAFLQRVAKFMLEDVYSYPRSNFYEVNNFFVLDGITTGSPVMLKYYDASKGRHVCILPHYTENYLMRDWFGDDIAYHRRFQLTNFQAMQAFAHRQADGTRDYGVLPPHIQAELRNGDHKTKHWYLCCIAQASDPIFQDLQPEYRIPLTHPWMQLWFCLDAGAIQDQKPLNYQPMMYGDVPARRPDGSTILMPTAPNGYWEKPFDAWHYHRAPHMTYAFTPGWLALPDVKGLNAAWRTAHDVAHEGARPATLAPDYLKGKLQLGAEGVSWIPDAKFSPEKLPRPYRDAKQYNWMMDFIERREQTVGRHFFHDMARMIENYSREHTQPPTAYQLSQMISETLVLIGPAITSYAGPVLNSINEQMLETELSTGRLQAETDPPDEVAYTNGKFSAVFTGPLIQGLRLAMLSKRIETPLMMASPLLELFPEGKQKIRGTLTVEKILEGGDFPQDCIVPEDEAQEMIAALNRAVAQRQMIQNLGAVADMVPKLQGQTENASPLQAISEAAA